MVIFCLEKHLDRINRIARIEMPSAEGISPQANKIPSVWSLSVRSKAGRFIRKVLESLGYDESKISELTGKKIVATGINKQ